MNNLMIILDSVFTDDIFNFKSFTEKEILTVIRDISIENIEHDKYNPTAIRAMLLILFLEGNSEWITLI